MKNKNTRRSEILLQLFIISLALLSWFIGFILTNQIKQTAQKDTTSQVSVQVKEAIEDIEKEKIASNYPDYNSLQDLHKLTIISDFISWTPNSKIDPSKTRAVVVLDEGELAKGYLYVKASVDGKPITRWESIYISMNYRGGHLLRTKGLAVPQGEKTELLYALDDISYVETIPYKENDEYSKTNWFNLFRPGSQIRIDAFISSLKPAIIEEMTIYYECADFSECKLSIK